uniref:Uncharacterized protein n=1 Tax=Sphaerodactylus townsendi TaxID=933632 RepID=A0ACB8EF44_9SAUR
MYRKSEPIGYGGGRGEAAIQPPPGHPACPAGEGLASKRLHGGSRRAATACPPHMAEAGRGIMEAETRSVQIQFPHYATVLLESLNKHRLEGKFCDISIHVQGRVFQAHKSVLAASSPYFHDKLLLNDTNCIVLPSVIEPNAFENLLQLIYSGRLKLLLEALPSHLLVASGLQMWQVLKIRVPHDDDDDDEEDDDEEERQAQICSGSTDGPVKVILDESEEGDRDGCSKGPGGSGSTSHEPAKIYYIKQERLDAEEASTSVLGGGLGSSLSEASFLKSLGRPLGMADMPGLCQAEIQETGEVSYILPSGVFSSSSASSFSVKTQPLPSDSSVPFPESSWKPVDLHGNEIIAHAVHGQKFKLKHHLTEHMKTHDGNLYACEDCGRKFRVQSCFLKHKELCKGQGWATAFAGRLPPEVELGRGA